jgi:uncharacterized SAM-binding protein YcdF (DUF218 family)
MDTAVGQYVVVILGAAVRPDGAPSSALARRIAGGHAMALRHPEAPVFCSGAAGRHGPSEASVMARLLTARGIAADRLVLDEASRDTLQTVAAASLFVRERGLAGVIVCSDSYHVPRARLIFALLGVMSRSGPVRSGLRETGFGYWLWMRLREALAIPYDGAITLVRRDDLRRGPGSVNSRDRKA